MLTVTSSGRRARPARPAAARATIRECRLLAVGEKAALRIAPDPTLERGGRIYQVTHRESAGGVDYVFLHDAL